VITGLQPHGPPGRDPRARLGEAAATVPPPVAPEVLALVAEHTHNAVVITDGEGRTLWVNPAFEALTGFSNAAMHGRKPGQVLQGPQTDAAVVALIRRRLQAGEAVHGLAIVNYDRLGRPYRVALDINPVRDEGGTVRHFIAIQTPMAERAAAGAEAVQEMLALERQDVLGRLKREVREPLNALLGFAQLIGTQALAANMPGIAQRAEHMESAGQRLLDLLDEVLSSQHAGERTAIQPVALHEALLRHLPREVALDVPALPAVRVWADPVLLRRALSVAGGLAASPGAAASGTTLAIDAPAGGRWVELRFGYRQPPDEHRQGLRLALLRHLVGEMGGELDAATVDGSGRLSLRLRRANVLADEDVPRGHADAPAAPGLWGTRAEVVGTVLYVEDYAGNIAVVEHALRSRPGVQLTVAPDVDTAERLLAEGPPPGLLLLDLVLPGRSGRALLETVRSDARLQGLHTVVLTSIDDDASEADLRALGVLDYLVKPLRLDRLLDLVDRCLGPSATRP
jgi:PAS domain S-box-containing protein